MLYGANGKPASATYSNGMTAVWTYNSDGSVHDIAYGKVPNAAYVSYDAVYGSNGKVATATYSNGMTAAWAYNADGSIFEIERQYPSGSAYAEVDQFYGLNDLLLKTVSTKADGTQIVNGHEGGLTIVMTGGNSTITGGGDDETVIAELPLGNSTFADFSKYLSGANHDTLSLPGASFSDSFAAVLAATHFNSGGATIAIDSTDSIRLPGLTHDLMIANSGDFTFHA